MRYEPEHTCFPAHRQCPGCAFELGQSLAKKKPIESAKYVWMITGSDNPCDIRRYAFSHEHGISQLAHTKDYKDQLTGGKWELFKLVKVNKKKAPPHIKR